MKTITITPWEAVNILNTIKGDSVQGYSLSDVIISLKLNSLIAPVTESGGEVSLEDTDYTWLKGRIERERWVVADERIVNMMKTIGVHHEN